MTMFATLYVLLFLNVAKSFNFDGKNVEIFTANQRDDYFGYSVLLQKKDHISRLFVGAPRANSLFLNESNKPGALYKCNIQDGRCAEHYVDDTVEQSKESKDGQLLGASLDGSSLVGESLVVCSPRSINRDNLGNHFANGICYLYKNSSTLNSIRIAPLSRKDSQILKGPSGAYYYYAFAEMGFAVKYNDVNNELLLGVPGVSSWSGAFLKYDINPVGLKAHGPLVFSKSICEYLGYSVSYGRFLKGKAQKWYLLGAPRAEKLFGEALLYEEGRVVHKTFKGDQRGSYFGSSVLSVDADNDGVDDVLVGAPTYFSQEYDEGCVYYYRNNGEGIFSVPIKLLGSSKPGARFGTSMAVIGDTNHDSYFDVVISAPYEDETGVIYIYLGSREGLSKTYSQRIGPEEFNLAVNVKSKIKGFGFALSRGLDLDNNGHNDLAIGAYVSGQAVLLKALPVIKYQASIVSHRKELSVDDWSPFLVEYCIKYTSTAPSEAVLTDIQLVPDNRLYSNYSSSTELVSHQVLCRNITMNLSAKVYDSTDPIIISLLYQQHSNTREVFCSNCPISDPNADSRIDLEIPFVYGCGDDKICDTDLAVKAHFLDVGEELIYGSTENVTLQVWVTNYGENAYVTQLNLHLPDDISIAVLPVACSIVSSLMKCLVENKLATNASKSMNFKLDIHKLDTRTQSLAVQLNVTSLGHEINEDNNKLVAFLPVVKHVIPKLTWESYPDQVSYISDDGETMDTILVTHKYSVRNLGISPYDIKLIVLLPLSIDETTIASLLTTEAFTSNIPELTCDISSDSKYSWNTVVPPEYANDNFNANMTMTDRIISITCDQQRVKCSSLICRGGQLSDLNQVATLDVKVQVDVGVLATIFKDELTKKDLIFFSSTAIALFESEGKAATAAYSVLFGKLGKQSVPLWIILLSAIGGLLLLIVIVYILWKSNFFKRPDKEKLLNEAQSSSNVAVLDDDELEDIDL